MKWINNYEINGTIKRKQGSGRNKITTIGNDNLIIDIIKKDNDSSINDIKNELEENNILISRSTIHRRLAHNVFIYKFPIKKPLLTVNHRKYRLD